MPPTAPSHRAQTLKQAKAAYKTRNQSTLSEREKKQLERSVELDRRAWRAREAEKRRAEAKVKREEKEKKEREAGGGMTSQRRCDRFGFVGSQMHLGAFFGGGKVQNGAEGTAGREVDKTGVEEDEEFGGSVDDESLLDAELKSEAGWAQARRKPTAGIAAGIDHTKTRREGRTQAFKPDLPVELDLFFDEMDNSTQIARDLETNSHAKRNGKPASPNTSFSSGDFDLSVEDIEEGEAKVARDSRTDADKKAMPPPALLSKQRDVGASTESMAAKRAMPPPPRPPKTLHTANAAGTRASVAPPKAYTRSSFALSGGFTVSELENFIDDDLQLTQVDPV